MEKTRDVFQRFRSEGTLQLPGLSGDRARDMAGSIGNVLIHRRPTEGPEDGEIKLIVIQKR